MLGTLIAKEDIDQYKIIPADTHITKGLSEKLSQAQRLGNEFKSKVSIIFQTEDGAKRVDTTVWSLIENYIQIKGGVLIPLYAIISVEF